MARPRNVTPSVSIHLHLPGSLGTRLNLLLWSEAEGRVPHGEYQKFFTDRLTEYFNHRTLDIGPFLGQLPGTLQVSGNDSSIAALLQHLQGARDGNEG